jgi:hypothetical protein
MMRLTPKSRKGLLLATGAVLFMMACAVFAQVQVPSKANSLGANDKNIANGNCFCHINAQTDNEKDPEVLILTPEIPDELGTGSSATFNVTINYAPATTNWRYGFGVSIVSANGKSTSGASLSSPVGTASENNTHLTHNEPLASSSFTMSLTAPSKAQRLKMTITGLAANNDALSSGDHWNYVIKYIDILKKREVFINTTVRNTGTVDAQNVNVTLYIDGQYMDQKNLPTVVAGKEQNITFNWDATNYKAGDYKVEVVIDTNQTTIELNEGNNKLVKTITLEDLNGPSKPAFDWTTAIYWILGLVIILLVVGLLYKYYG